MAIRRPGCAKAHLAADDAFERIRYTRVRLFLRIAVGLCGGMMSESAYESNINSTHRYVVLAIGMLVAVVSLPWATVRVPDSPSVTPFVVGGILGVEFATSFLLFAQFRDTGTWSLLLLAGAYSYSGSMLIVYLLTFPGAVLPGQIVIGNAQSAAVVFQLWTNGFAALTLMSIVLETRKTTRRIQSVDIELMTVAAIGAVLTLSICGAVGATTLVTGMPDLLAGSSWTGSNNALNLIGVAMMAAGVVMILLVPRSQSPLFMWLSLTLCAMIFSNLIALAGGGRYTVGWLMARISWVISGNVLFLFFMTEFAKQQQLLSRTNITLEKRVEVRTADLTRMVQQRDLLLREVYHRVNNNLQLIASIIALESRLLSDAASRTALHEIHNRVTALALVHQRLMSSEDLQTVVLAEILQVISDNVAASHGSMTGMIRVAVQAERFPVHLEFAITVGLLTTELLSNAFNRPHATEVLVEFRKQSVDQAVLTVSDNGSPSGDPMTARSDLGSRFIDGLIQRLQAQMRITHQDGVRVEIHIPLAAIIPDTEEAFLSPRTGSPSSATQSGARP